MSTTAIGYAGLTASLVLVAVAVAISVWQQLRLSRTILWASVRAAAQLLAVGAALALVLDPDASLVWSWLWVVAMVGFAGVTVRRRAPEVPGILGLAVLAMAVVVTVSLSVIFGFGIFPVEGRTIIPMAGMMIGNSMTASVLVARRVVGELSDQRHEVEARLALGQPWPVASRPYVRSALRTALIPQIESTKSVGLVFLPGGDDGPDPGRRRCPRRRPGAAGDHVPDPGIGGHQRGRHRVGPDPPPVHARPPAPPARSSGHLTVGVAGGRH